MSSTTLIFAVIAVLMVSSVQAQANITVVTDVYNDNTTWTYTVGSGNGDIHWMWIEVCLDYIVNSQVRGIVWSALVCLSYLISTDGTNRCHVKSDFVQLPKYDGLQVFPWQESSDQRR